MKPAIAILGIESSCDETSASVCCDGKIISNVTATQEIHQQYGGVVPELASRAHMEHIIPVIDQSLRASRIPLDQLDAIAFTESPGLIGALLVGSGVAKSLAMALQKPLITVHHMQAHVLSNLIDDPKPNFPFLCLTVSGGHTQIVLCRSPLDMEVLGETIDDAAGEAFDKSAKLLGLPYPGGPLIDRHASQGNPLRFSFAEPNIAGLDFSFSGVKTSILYFLQDQLRKDPSFVEKNIDDLCASIQHRIVDILLKKIRRAALDTGIRELCLAGGVAANKGLRHGFLQVCDALKASAYIPEMSYCTDNAGMIAITGYYKYLSGQVSDLSATAHAQAEW